MSVDSPLSRLSKRMTWTPGSARAGQNGSGHAVIWVPRPMISSRGSAAGSPKVSYSSSTPFAEAWAMAVTLAPAIRLSAPVGTMGGMQTALLDTPIGTLTVGATARGLRLVQFPRDRAGEGEGEQAGVPEQAGKAGKPDRPAAGQLGEAGQELRADFGGPRTPFHPGPGWD